MSSNQMPTESQDTDGQPIESPINESKDFSIIEMTDKDIEGINDCTICLSAITSGETIMKLICSHYYHQNCASIWLKNHSSCPQCRHQLTDNPYLEVTNDSLHMFAINMNEAFVTIALTIIGSDGHRSVSTSTHDIEVIIAFENLINRRLHALIETIEEAEADISQL